MKAEGYATRTPSYITLKITAAEYIVLLAAIDNAADDVDALDLSFEGFNSLIAARLRRIAKTLRNI